ncbi:Toxin co-regulated pilus biosynthesis protein Q [Caballeronia calidae]|uniref:Toxin co-regulated pilus biosynthesis protein Q n=2 Tax=Caballeronia calidae TaxID=1777139 RepID=A0A158EFV9_9BURK|nr:Toxin co-regulated pilus biosynthesis protein Q [Caballeronia calidae]
MKWAQRAGWKVLWNLPDDNNWIVPGDEVCGTDFEAAVNHVIEELASNGADVVADSWRGNHTIVMTQSGATE